LGTGDFRTAEAFTNRDVNYIHDNLAIIHIFFIDNAYGGFTKSELIGFTEFLSNTGGLLGLFMGFSVISLIEIIYFLSLRPYCAHKRTAVEMNKPSEKILWKNTINNNNNIGLRGANNKATLIIGQPFPTVLNEYYMRTETFQRQSFCKQIHSKLISSFRYIKAKLMSVWNALVERKDEGQAPYPYHN
jgi:hypothetical protein